MSEPEANDAAAQMRNRIIKRAALEFHDGIYGTSVLQSNLSDLNFCYRIDLTIPHFLIMVSDIYQWNCDFIQLYNFRF